MEKQETELRNVAIVTAASRIGGGIALAGFWIGLGLVILSINLMD